LDRSLLSDAQWERMAALLPGKPGDPGRHGAENRRFLEAVLWIARTGAPWRDLDHQFGCWNSVFRRFRRWSIKGVFEKIFSAVADEPDLEYACIDGTIIRVHQHGTGAKGGTHMQAIGRSRGGLSTKILALVDALGNLVRFVLLPGQRHDSIGVESLIEDIKFDALLADKAFDSDPLRTALDRRAAQAVIPPKANRATSIVCDYAMYSWRHLVENFFCHLKNFRRIATRYDKTDTSYSAMINLAAISIALR
jgi:transposase